MNDIAHQHRTWQRIKHQHRVSGGKIKHHHGIGIFAAAHQHADALPATSAALLQQRALASASASSTRATSYHRIAKRAYQHRASGPHDAARFEHHGRRYRATHHIFCLASRACGDNGGRVKRIESGARASTSKRGIVGASAGISGGRTSTSDIANIIARGHRLASAAHGCDNIITSCACIKRGGNARAGRRAAPLHRRALRYAVRCARHAHI